MKALLYKQFRLVTHPMTPVFALFGAMLLIPAYPYTIAFFYVMLGLFFSFMQGREQRDADFSALLPIRKRDTVKTGFIFVLIIELLSLVIAIPFAILSVRINPNGGNPVGLDANVAFFGLVMLIYAVFNSVFLISFYKTGYKVGSSFLKAVIPTSLIMIVFEVLPHIPAFDWLNDISAAGQIKQLPLLAAGAVVYAAALLLSYRRSAQLYEKVDL